MAYYFVDTQIDLEGNIKVIVKVPLKFILPSTKYKYNLIGRKIILERTIEYFNSKEKIEEIIKNAELDFKDKFKEEIKIAKIVLKSSKITEDFVILEYETRLKGEYKRPKENIIE